jgi:hypothetical protein
MRGHYLNPLPGRHPANVGLVHFRSYPKAAKVADDCDPGRRHVRATPHNFERQN